MTKTATRQEGGMWGQWFGFGHSYKGIQKSPEQVAKDKNIKDFKKDVNEGENGMTTRKVHDLAVDEIANHWYQDDKNSPRCVTTKEEYDLAESEGMQYVDGLVRSSCNNLAFGSHGIQNPYKAAKKRDDCVANLLANLERACREKPTAERNLLCKNPICDKEEPVYQTIGWESNQFSNRKVDSWLLTPGQPQHLCKKACDDAQDRCTGYTYYKKGDYEGQICKLHEVTTPFLNMKTSIRDVEMVTKMKK